MMQSAVQGYWYDFLTCKQKRRQVTSLKRMLESSEVEASPMDLRMGWSTCSRSAFSITSSISDTLRRNGCVSWVTRGCGQCLSGAQRAVQMCI